MPAKIWAGLLLIPVYYGFRAMFALLLASDTGDAQLASAMLTFRRGCRERGLADPVDFYKLERMVVDPTMQGEGIGSAALSAALRSLDTGEVHDPERHPLA